MFEVCSSRNDMIKIEFNAWRGSEDEAREKQQNENRKNIEGNNDSIDINRINSN